MSAKPLAQLLVGKRLLIFDFDGTLADTSPLHEAAFNAVLAPWGIMVDYPAIAGLRTRDALSTVLSAHGIDLPDKALQTLVEAKQNYARQLIAEELQPLPGVDDFLRWAGPRYRLAMYSSGSRGTVSLALKRLGYAEWFDPMLCAEDVTQAKPHPEGFLKVLALCGVTADEGLIFEDSASGIQAAHVAKIACIEVKKQTFHRLITNKEWAVSSQIRLCH